MSRRIVTTEDFVVRTDGSKIQVLLGRKLAGDLVHVTIELFEQALEAREHRVERFLVAGEVGAHKGLEGGRVAVFRAPELHDLVEAGAEAGLLGFSVFRQ